MIDQQRYPRRSSASDRRPLRVGVQLPEVERDVRWPELLDLARRAEDVGLDSVWVGDHLLYRFADGSTRGPWEAWSLLAALAASTSRVTLGPLVACTAFRNPAMLAKEATTIDEISGGRFVLGLGAGWNPVEFAAFGLPFDHRIARFEEAFTIIRSLLRDGAVDFAGQYFSARDCELVPRGPTPGGPALMIGSIGPRMLAATAPHVDAWNAWFADTGNTPDGAAAAAGPLATALTAAGRASDEVVRTVAVLLQLPGGAGRTMGDTSESQQVRPLAGPPEELAAGLRAYADAGITEVQLVLDPITADSIEALRPVLAALDA
ncbi:F420-dependent glucose-6-phosphate dehydrogenase [Cellulomonas sp. T2.31MG-18]|uniref:LLM class flavin-dependent oxidoreductase n=1 Tax=Cellulomonas sp. T2.31MG-18 TaxID=3157619 RepID=UPI0035E9733C